MSASRLLAGLTIAALALSGCSSSKSESSKSSSSTSTTAAKSTTSSGNTAESVTTVTADPATFAATIEGLTSKLDGKSGDLCGLVAIVSEAGTLGNPVGADQAKAAAHFLSVAYGKIADAVPAKLQASADDIRAAAASMEAETSAADFNADEFLKNGPKAFTDKKFLAAMTALSSEITSCAQAQAGGATTVPTGDSAPLETIPSG